MVVSGYSAPLQSGNTLPLKAIPLGIEIHNIEIEPSRGGKLVKAAGTAARLVAKEGSYATIRLPSGETRLIHQDCWVTIGRVGNSDHANQCFGKAGRKRWMGRRPHVRGSVMHPVDHPHGGGEGRTSGGRHPSTPWGIPTKGYKTRKNQRTDDLIVRRRAKRK